ncbi:hypothetical protein GCM10009554_80220 [Kribbella koreensis]|uniref:Uncharacterized protein n=1 Tax=Kribbella koreensis TaxID=57909 RepID=A0ABN1RRU9_9ACTN
MKRLAIASVAVGVLLAGFFAVLVVKNVPSTPTPLETEVVQLSSDGLMLWASVDEAAPTCEVKTADGVDVPLTTSGDGEVAKADMRYWYLFARSTKPVPAGEVRISCRSKAAGVQYAFSPRSSFVAFVGGLLGVVFSLLAFFALGTWLLTIGIRRRRAANTPPPGTTPPGNPPPGDLTPGGRGLGDLRPDYPPITYHPAERPGRPDGS